MSHLHVRRFGVNHLEISVMRLLIKYVCCLWLLTCEAIPMLNKVSLDSVLFFCVFVRLCASLFPGSWTELGSIYPLFTWTNSRIIIIFTLLDVQNVLWLVYVLIYNCP